MTATIILLVLCAALATFGVLVRRARCRRMLTRLSLGSAFAPGDFHNLDLHLDRVDVTERRQLSHALTHYVSGEAGHVVFIWDQRDALVLQLSDGRVMTLAGVLQPTRRLVRQRAAQDQLRPQRLDRDDRWYRVVLRTDEGGEVQVPARMVSITD